MKRLSSNERTLGLRTIMEVLDVGIGVALGVFTVTTLVLVLAISFFVRSAPPREITISSGPDGSVFYKTAQKYAKVLERNGVKINILTSKGSLQNLQRLVDPSSQVDVAFAQAGITLQGSERLISLGSISYQPILVFYRGPTLDVLSKLMNKKIAIGPVGSGARTFALALLEVNGIKEGGSTVLLDWEGEQAATALLDKKIDAVFAMSEGASSDILRKLMRSDEVHLFNFKQANAYSRKIDNLNVLDLPEGAVDFGLDIPKHDVTLLGPMIELVVQKSLHPAISDLLLEAATEIHNRPGIFQKRGEFPTPIEHSIRISDDASRFYKSGKSLFYRYLPFWLASLTSRIIVVFVPMLVLLIPTLKSVPAFFRWRIRSRIHRRYRELLALEKSFAEERDETAQEHLRKEFDQIEEAVNKMKVPASFADQFYGLRGHIDYVRRIFIPK